MFKSLAMLAIGILLFTLSTAQAVIILDGSDYVDANPFSGGNTVLVSDGSDGITGGWEGTGIGQWNARNVGAPQEGSYLLENNNDTTLNAPEIETTITGLNPFALYNIYVVYETLDVTAGGSAVSNFDWHVNAGLTSSVLATFDSTNGAYTGDSAGGSGIFADQREGLVGQVSHVSSAAVFVGGDLANGTDNRTRYDGVAFEFVEFVPEPATLGMVLIAVPFLARRRRVATVS